MTQNIIVKLMTNIDGEAYNILITEVEKYSEKLKLEAMELDELLICSGIQPRYLVVNLDQDE